MFNEHTRRTFFLRDLFSKLRSEKGEVSNDPKPSTPSEGGIDLSKYVPKEELDKVSQTKDSAIGDLKKALDDAKLKLVDPEYIQYLESKRKPKQGETATTQQPGESLAAYEKRLQALESAQQQMLAFLELADVEKRYTDFNEYRDDVIRILDVPGTNVTIEQAYKIAKADKATTSSTPKAPEKPSHGNERPGGTLPDEDLKPREFKTQAEANAATLREMQDKHGLKGDII